MPEAVHLGDLLRIWLRPGARFTPSPPDFQGPARAHRTPPEPRRFPRHGPLSWGEPIPGRPALHKEKRALPGATAGFSGIGRVTALDASRRPSPPLRIRGSEPDSLSMVRLVFRPYTQVGRPICTSGPLRTSTRVSSGFALPRHSSPSFGS
uniref:Uncharacterized protein n=1 Tax=Equus asinus TaxID=9793 RepID=A0A9L0J317_EQUAS